MSIYPQGRMWFNEEDQINVNQLKSKFEEKHMSSLYQSHIFEKMCSGDMREAMALTEKHVQKHIVAFRDDKLTQDKSSPNKMMYDSIRIIGLMLSCQIDKTLIKLHGSP